jgi:hypothetical protein
MNDLTIDVAKSYMNPSLGNTVLLVVPYGSRMYGLDTETSDFDYKAVFLPPMEALYFRDNLIGKKVKLTQEGVRVSDEVSGGPGSLEIEYIPVMTFLLDVFRGQTYALEIACWLKNHLDDMNFVINPVAGHAVKILEQHTLRSCILSMSGFAKKQTFDYVLRGERYEAYQAIQKLLRAWWVTNMSLPGIRRTGKFVSDNSEKLKGLDYCKVFENHSLTFCGRLFEADKNALDLIGHVDSQVREFGERSKKAGEEKIDWSSLSHAIRVYWQCLDFMDKGVWTYPLSKDQREFLLKVKSGQADTGETRLLLKCLDEEVALMRDKVLSEEKANGLEFENLTAGVRGLISKLMTSYYFITEHSSKETFHV